MIIPGHRRSRAVYSKRFKKKSNAISNWNAFDAKTIFRTSWRSTHIPGVGVAQWLAKAVGSRNQEFESWSEHNLPPSPPLPPLPRRQVSLKIVRLIVQCVSVKRNKTEVVSCRVRTFKNPRRHKKNTSLLKSFVELLGFFLNYRLCRPDITFVVDWA